MAVTEAKIMAERNHYLITPRDPVQKAVTEEIERAAARNLLQNYKIRLNGSYLTTFACVYLEAIIRMLRKITRDTNVTDTGIDFVGLFRVESNNRSSEEGDKDGNINIVFTPGPLVTGIMERDYAPELSPDVVKDEANVLSAVQNLCAQILSEKHKTVVDDRRRLTIIAYVYFQYMFRQLKLMAKGAEENGTGSAVSLNFLEMIEVHCNIEHETNPDNPDLVSTSYVIKIRPGFQSKLLIKNDDVTEFRVGG